MKTGNRVRLKTFDGKVASETNVHPSEDYWKLIGKTGTIQKDPQEKNIFASFSKEPRVLIKFDQQVADYGLIAHNNIENSL